MDIGSLCRDGNVKVQLGHMVLWLQQNWFEHDQTPGSFCQIKAGLLYMAGGGTWCTELSHTAEPGCHKLTVRCASKKHCLSGAVLLCCSHCVLFRLVYGGTAQSSCPGADLLLCCRQDSGKGEV